MIFSASANSEVNGNGKHNDVIIKGFKAISVLQSPLPGHVYIQTMKHHCTTHSKIRGPFQFQIDKKFKFSFP